MSNKNWEPSADIAGLLSGYVGWRGAKSMDIKLKNKKALLAQKALNALLGAQIGLLVRKGAQKTAGISALRQALQLPRKHIKALYTVDYGKGVQMYDDLIKKHTQDSWLKAQHLQNQMNHYDSAKTMAGKAFPTLSKEAPRKTLVQKLRDQRLGK